MIFRNLLQKTFSDSKIALSLAGTCVVLYLVIFAILYFVASSHGTSLEKMIGLDLPHYADTTEYRNLAQSMLTEGRFSLGSVYPLESARVPGYPAFFAVVLTIFGTLLVVPLIQIALTAATVALIFLIGIRYFPRPVAIAAAVLYMIDPIVVYAAWTPISESLFMLLFVGSIYAIGFPMRRAWVPYVIAGILFGLSLYVRLVVQYLALIVACITFAQALPWKIRLRHAAIFLIAIFCVVGPWMARNYVQYGHFAMVPTHWQLFAYNMALFEQARTGVSYEQIQIQNTEQFGTTSEKILRQFEYSEEIRAIALEKIFAHPFQYTIFHLYKSAALFFTSSIVKVKYHGHTFGIFAGEFQRGEGFYGMMVQKRWDDAFHQILNTLPRQIERVLYVSLYIFAFYVTILALLKRIPHATFIVCAFVMINVYALTIGPGSDETRYRMPIEPFVFLLGGYGVYLTALRIRSYFSRRH